MSKTLRIIKRRNSGQAMVEFALVFTVLLVVIFGLMEAGRMLFIYTSVFSASREGARYGSAAGTSSNGMPYFQDCTGIEDAAEKFGFISTITVTDIKYYDRCDNLIATCSTIPSKLGQLNLGSRMEVTTTSTFEPVVGLVNLPTITFTSTATRTIIRDVKRSTSAIPAYGSACP